MKRLSSFLICGAAVLVGLGAAAQPTPAAPKGGAVSPGAASQVREAALVPAVQKASPAFLKFHDSSKGKFGQIQSLLSQIESGKVLHDGDAEKLDKMMFEYANELKAAFDQASADAKEAAESKGRKGSVESLKVFETQAQQHEQASKGFESRMIIVQNKLKSGEIKLDKQLLQKMSPGEMQQFKQFLAPGALQQMEQLHPDLMKGAPAKSSLERTEETPQLVAQAIPVPLGCRVADLVGNLIEEKAEAALAFSCIGPCKAKNWTACVNCIVSKGPAAINAWNTFVGCWNGAGPCNWRPWTWGNCARKAACLAVFIAKLA
jgi:hypothetical protein